MSRALRRRHATAPGQVRMRASWLLLLLSACLLAACGSAPKKPAGPTDASSPSRHGARVAAPAVAAGPCSKPYAPAQEDPSTRGNYVSGGLYAPHVRDSTPDYVPNLDCIAEPRVVDEPRSPIGNRSPYTVLGRQYHVMDRHHDYVEQGLASYYGAKFHGRLTSNREVYDMYAFTAAHKTLPLPSFARITNLDNGRSVVVRVNDRGPFHDGRVVDLSYAAAVKLDIVRQGTGRVEVRALAPGDTGSLLASASLGSGSGSVTSAKRVSAMDDLVDRLPAAATATAPVATRQAADASQPWRYHASAKPGQIASADEFEAWMASRGVRVATGRPGTPVATAPAAPATGAVDGAAAVAPSASANRPAAQVDPVSLQVASFASRDNADRALARLLAAGIAGANLSSIQRDGRSLWRLRVGPLERSLAAELVGRIAGLGLGTPHFAED